jgi:hypothetical protein
MMALPLAAHGFEEEESQNESAAALASGNRMKTITSALMHACTADDACSRLPLNDHSVRFITNATLIVYCKLIN